MLYNMASPATLPVVDAPYAHVGHSVAKPTSCCDMNSPRPETVHIKDASKRKRVNRTAKLKQCKLDARREQWLSQVTGKHVKADQEQQHTEDSNVEENKDDPGEVVLPEDHLLNLDLTETDPERLSVNSNEGMDRTSPSHLRIKRPENQSPIEDVDSKHEQPGGTGFDFGDLSTSMNSCMSDCSEADSSPKSYGDKSPKSKVTKLGRDFRGGRGRSVSKYDKECLDRERNRGEGKGTENFTRFSSSPSSASGGNESGQGHDSEDDWEAAADALDLHASSRDKASIGGVSGTGRSSRDRASSSSAGGVSGAGRSQHSDLVEGNGSLNKQSVAACNSDMESGSLKPDYKVKAGMLRSASGRAWRPDDISRPTCLPSLAKQQSLPTHHGSQQWSPTQKAAWAPPPPPAPTHCPICIEELDSTDSSFAPCCCGFRLCLFCYHKIASEDGRCPGCRKAYSTDVAGKPPHSASLRRWV